MMLDWSQCSAVERVSGKQSGALVFAGTRMPVSVVFSNLKHMDVAVIPSRSLVLEVGPRWKTGIC